MPNSAPGRFWKGGAPPTEQEQDDLLTIDQGLWIHDGTRFVPLAAAGNAAQVVANTAAITALQGMVRGDLLTNGGQEIWTRGFGPFTTTGAFAADKWVITLGGSSTLSVSRDVADVGLGSLWAAGFVYVHAAAGSAAYSQLVEGFEQLRGSVVTFAALVQTTVPGSVRLRVYDGSLTYDSPYNVAAGLEVLSVTLTVPVGATLLELRVRCDVASCGGKIDNCTLVLGSTASSYAALHPAAELTRAQRYYEAYGTLASGVTSEAIGVAQAVSTTAAYAPFKWTTTKAQVPTITFSNVGHFTLFTAAGAAQATTGLTATAITRSGCTFLPVVAANLVAGNACHMYASNAAARIQIEAAP